MFSLISIVAAAILTNNAIAAPISTASLEVDSNFATNVIMTSGASQFAMWVPTDGNSYSTSSMTCLNVQSSSYGSCDITSIDQIAAVSGYTCAFSGSNGWTGSQVGTSGSGWLKVAPPQTIVAAACMQ